MGGVCLWEMKWKLVGAYLTTIQFSRLQHRLTFWKMFHTNFRFAASDFQKLPFGEAIPQKCPFLIPVGARFFLLSRWTGRNAVGQWQCSCDVSPQGGGIKKRMRRENTVGWRDEVSEELYDIVSRWWMGQRPLSGSIRRHIFYMQII